MPSGPYVRICFGSSRRHRVHRLAFGGRSAVVATSRSGDRVCHQTCLPSQSHQCRSFLVLGIVSSSTRTSHPCCPHSADESARPTMSETHAVPSRAVPSPYAGISSGCSGGAAVVPISTRNRSPGLQPLSELRKKRTHPKIYQGKPHHRKESA